VEHPTGKIPEKVVLVGLGPTKVDFFDVLASPDAHNIVDYDEVWGVNAAINCLPVDVSFAMDDYMVCKGRNNYMTRLYEETDKPIITSIPRPTCKTAVEYPLLEVLKLPRIHERALNHTAAYIVAYAIVLGVKELVIFGCDYIDPSSPYNTNKSVDHRARYMGGMGYWIGYASAMGTTVAISPNSPLLDADKSTSEIFYGYLVKPIIKRED